MEKGVTFIGTLLVDQIKMVDAYPPAGMLCQIHGMEQSVGGLAANTAIALKVLDARLSVRSLGMVGADSQGAYLKAKLSAHGVDTGGILTHPTLPTSFTDVMTERGAGVRTFFHHGGACAAYAYEDIDFARVTTSHAHMGYALLLRSLDAPLDGHGTGMARALRSLRGRGVRTSLDMVSDALGRYREVVLPSLPEVDLLFANELEAEGVTGLSVCGPDGAPEAGRVAKALRALLDLGVRDLAVLHAPAGGYCMGQDHALHFAPAVRLPPGYIRGAVGAGDAFCAGMLCALLNGQTPREGLALGNLAAAACLSHENAVDGLRPAEALLEYVHGGYLRERKA